MGKWKELLEVTKNWRYEKAEYKEFEHRIEALPEDYRFVFKEIQKYMWEFSDFTGHKMLAAMYDLLVIFEDSAENGQNVFAVTGDDVGEFASDIVREVSNTWVDERKIKLNKKVQKFRDTHTR
ncbi:DUF1048 domain-containing protein [Enterococcus sp. LJL128]